jgi:hypothetical protein
MEDGARTDPVLFPLLPFFSGSYGKESLFTRGCGSDFSYLPSSGVPSCHRTNTDPKLGQTATRVSDRSRFRRLAGRITV